MAVNPESDLQELLQNSTTQSELVSYLKCLQSQLIDNQTQFINQGLDDERGQNDMFTPPSTPLSLTLHHDLYLNSNKQSQQKQLDSEPEDHFEIADGRIAEEQLDKEVLIDHVRRHPCI